MSDLDVRRLEEVALNAWPALHTFLYDGWVLRLANGYTKRANSVTPLYAGGAPLGQKIDTCAAVYRQRGLPPIFRLPSFLETDELEAELVARGYAPLDPTCVQGLDISNYRGEQAATAEVLAPTPEGIDVWLELFHALNPQRLDRETHALLLQRALGELCLLLLRDGRQRVVACGLAVLEGSYLGLFDIVTAAEARRRGYGRQATESLLAWGRARGARFAYLQVLADNEPALRLYAGLGFTDAYTYRYRILR